MATPVGNVVIGTDTFGTWLTKFNQVATALSNVVVTVATNTAGALTNGNGIVNGVFLANVLVACSALRGGNVTTSANITISSNLVVSNNVLFVSVAGVEVGIGTYSPDATLSVSGTANISGNVRIGGNFTLIGNTTISGAANVGNTLHVTGNVTIDGVVNSIGFQLNNATLITNVATVSNQTINIIDSFPKTQSRAIKYMILAYNTAGNTPMHSTEIMVIHDGTVLFESEYGVVASSNCGSFSANINNANVELYFTSNQAVGFCNTTNTYTVKFLRTFLT